MRERSHGLTITLYLVWFVLPLAPIGLFLLGGVEDWTGLRRLAGFAGIVAYVLLCGQLFLASKPLGLERKVGTRTYYTLHMLAALGGLAAALTHFLIKSGILGVQPSSMTAPGALADLMFQISVVFALFFLSAPIFPKVRWLRALREWTRSHWGWTHSRLRLVHNLTVLAVLLIIVHVLVVPTTQRSWYSWGFMAMWGLICVGFYIAYRFRGREEVR